jgi:hypothetical protein
MVLAIAGSLALLEPTAAHACIEFIESNLEDIRRADVVFVGDIISYEIVERDSGYGYRSEEGLLTINVVNTIKGSVPSTVRLAWPNSTFAFPPDILVFRPAIYAATYDPSGFSRTGSASPPKDGLFLFQPPCSGSFILPHSAKDQEVIREVLAGGSATSDDLSGWADAEKGPLTAIRRSESPVGVFNGVILVAISFLLFGLVMAWCARRMNRA